MTFKVIRYVFISISDNDKKDGITMRNLRDMNRSGALGTKGIVIIIVIIVVLAALAIGTYFIFYKEEGKESILLATTTSVADSGLLDHILPTFEKKYDIEVKVTAVGSGQAIELGKNGNADVLFVHSPTDEKNFVSQGYGTVRKTLLWNTFLIVGPTDNPASLNATDNASAAFTKIVDSKSTFTSRGDASGTNKKELAIWTALNKTQDTLKATSWYLSVGQGMGETLTMTNEKKAYTLTDEATWYKMEGSLPNLKVYVNNDKVLLNYYSVIPVNGSKFANVNEDGAAKFLDWMSSQDTLNMIKDYKVNGHTLFQLYGVRDGAVEPTD